MPIFRGVRVPGGAVEPVQLGAVAASWGAFGSIPGSPGFSSFPAPLTLTLKSNVKPFFRAREEIYFSN